MSWLAGAGDRKGRRKRRRLYQSGDDFFTPGRARRFRVRAGTEGVGESAGKGEKLSLSATASSNVWVTSQPARRRLVNAVAADAPGFAAPSCGLVAPPGHGHRIAPKFGPAMTPPPPEVNMTFDHRPAPSPSWARHLARSLAALALLIVALPALPALAATESSTRAAQDHPDHRPIPPALGRLEQLVGVWQVTSRAPDGNGGWHSASPVFVEAAPILRGHFVAMEGLFPMPGLPRPLAMLLLFSRDPFQDLVRVAVLDDLVGLLDGFTGTWEGDELVATNLACDSRWQGKAHGRLRLVADGADRFEMHSETSLDRGATWTLGLIASFERQ
jgi:hypothetical protein